MSVIEDSISSLIKRVQKLEEESEINAKVNSSNRKAIKLLSEAINEAKSNDKSEANVKIQKAEEVVGQSSKELDRLPEITIDRKEIRTKQQEQQILLKSYRDTQEKQKEQQQKEQ